MVVVALYTYDVVEVVVEVVGEVMIIEVVLGHDVVVVVKVVVK